MRAESVCAIMAKQPAPGKTKTRLYPALSPQAAADLYEALLLDSIDLAAGLTGIDLAVAVTPPEASPYFERQTPPGTLILPVEGKDIGECLEVTFAHLFNHGYHTVLALNADGPSLPPEYIHQALRSLDKHDLVLGPGHDGGYYLMGMKTLHRPLFAGISWSTDKVLTQTLRTASQMGLRSALVPEWYDVDTPQDLQRLMAELHDLPDSRLSHCRRLLSGWDLDLLEG